MPFVSRAQEGYLHEHPEILGKAGLHEWDAATKGKHLPEHAHKDTQMAHKKQHPYKRTHIEHHEDGSHTIHHEHEQGPEGDKHHAVASHDEMMDKLQDNLQPNGPEPEPEPEPGGEPADAVAAGAAPQE